MATGNSTKKSCCKCNENRRTFTCDGCQRVFCFEHVQKHSQELSQQIHSIRQEHDNLRRDLSQKDIKNILLTQIDSWEKESITTIQGIAKKVRTDIKRVTEETTNRLLNLMHKLSDELRSSPQNDQCTEDNLGRWMKQLEEIRKGFETPFKTSSFGDISGFFHLQKNLSLDNKQKDKGDSNSMEVDRSNEEPKKAVVLDTLPTNGSSTIDTSNFSNPSAAYPCVPFHLNESTNIRTGSLFLHLMKLLPMNKSGPMSGNCDKETTQMEQFLSQTFGFRNIPGKDIVQGVKSFLLGRPPHLMTDNLPLHFPGASNKLFSMTVKEITEWQQSYKVYADKNIKGMDEAFLQRALQGQSDYAEEAFRMKFVVRISTCPILMEFDAKIISRSLNEEWPNRIKLVSVTGIDFAARIHDLGDILYYISNWKEVFEIDSRSGFPFVFNNRDFHSRSGAPPAKIREHRVRNSLIRMARLRLRACDEEGVQIVVETGIGLGVFAGSHIGIDGKIRALSAEAIRTVLEQDGSSYKHICAIIFALPNFSKSRAGSYVPDTFDDFVAEFQKSTYNGPIPVLIADQDMHRLTVAIARQGFIVSELNPADSHGVFGEYWQNRGPAVEEKLALTTAGLLVQHHLINSEVLNSKNYHFVEINGGDILDMAAAIKSDSH